MESIELVAVLVGIVLIAGVSKRIRDTVVTLPMLCVLFGLFVGWAFRDSVVLSHDDPMVEIIAKVTLMFLLATDASRINLNTLLRFHNLPLRLLLIGLPLTMALGTVLAHNLFGTLLFWEAAILAVSLAPTDASPAESAVNNPKVPVRIRQALDIEGGLNDGITMPFLVLAISLAVSEEIGGGSVLSLAASGIIFGVLVGAMMGYLGAKYIHWGKTSNWMSSRFQKIGWLALVLLTYGIAEEIGGNGFIAAFGFGITSGHIIRGHQEEALHEFVEVENSLLILVTYVLFGMVMLDPVLKAIDLTVVLYALLSLTVVRMLPVAISLIGTKLRATTVLYIGWFGPRGIATILYVLTVIDLEEIAGRNTIFDVAVFTVFLSVMLHGISAAPLSDWYGKRMADLDEQGAADAEMEPVPEMPTRTRRVPARPDSSTVAYSS